MQRLIKTKEVKTNEKIMWIIDKIVKCYISKIRFNSCNSPPSNYDYFNAYDDNAGNKCYKCASVCYIQNVSA